MYSDTKSAVIQVDNVVKSFPLPHNKPRTLKQLFTGSHKARRSRSKASHQIALKGVSFSIEDGEFFGIVGRNGSGKSTLLKMLAGIYPPTKGRVATSGRIVPFIELGVGFNPELSGRDNVYLNGALLGFSSSQVDSMYHDIVAFAGLERFMDQKLKNYSSGMQVRLAFSMAIRSEADILLIDEVLAVGDAAFQRKCFDYFKKIKRQKQTVVFVSHDMGAVQQYCDRALLIEKGKVVKIGNADSVATAYSRLFLQEKAGSSSSAKAAESPSNEERWGDNQARWQEVEVELLGIDDSTLEPKTIRIKASGEAKQTIEYPIFGFSIKDSEGKQIIGTNTIRKRITVKPFNKGDNFSLSWNVPNIFNSGMYYVDCTIAHDKADMVSDRWPDATSFEIRRLEVNPYPMYADVGFALRGSKA